MSKGKESYIDWEMMDNIMNHLSEKHPQCVKLEERTKEGLLTMGHTLRQLGGMLIDEVNDNRINH